MNRLLFLGALACLPLCACSDDDDDPVQPNISSTLASKGDFDTLLAAVEAAGLLPTLNGPGPFTLLAPTDAAFQALPAGTLDALLLPENQDQLAAILQYHLLGAEVLSGTVVTLDSATTLQGDDVLIDQVGAALYVNDARVTEADVDASNGVIHVIDAVLLPPASLLDTLSARGFDTLAAAVEAAQLEAALSGPGPRTLLAPTDAAFAALPAGVLDDLLLPENQDELIDVLTYHVIGLDVTASAAVAAETASAANGVTLLFESAEGGATVNAVSISRFNIPCTNAVLHVIDAVLIPPVDITTLAAEAGLTTLVDLVVTAGLEATLAGDGPFTVFAPTNEAFAALGQDLLDALVLPENQALLTDILLYHVVGDELTATEVLAAESLTTLEGSPLAVGTEPPSVGGVPIEVTNVLARNGIVHVLGAVLVPPDVMLPLMQGSAPVALQGPRELALEPHGDQELGLEGLPAWYGAPGARTATWSGFDASLVEPLRADEGSGVSLMLEGVGAVDAGGALAPMLPIELRASLQASALPREVVLELRARGGEELRPLLRYVDEQGEVRRLEPGAVEPQAGGARSFIWRAADAGRPVGALEIALPVRPGAAIERLRLSQLE